MQKSMREELENLRAQTVEAQQYGHILGKLYEEGEIDEAGRSKKRPKE